MIIPNITRDLINHVVIIATGLDKTSGTIYAYVRKDSDGYYLKADNTWVTPAPTGIDLPVATYVNQGLWKLNLQASVTNVLIPGDSVSCRMTDSETPALATVISDVVEHVVDLLTSTRSVFAGGNVASVTSLTASFLDVAVSSRLASASYVAPPTAEFIASCVYQLVSGSFEEVSALLHKNSVIDQQSYDAGGNMLSARLRSYDSASNLLLSGSTGLSYTFAVSASYGMVGYVSGALNSFSLRSI